MASTTTLRVDDVALIVNSLRLKARAARSTADSLLADTVDHELAKTQAAKFQAQAVHADDLADALENARSLVVVEI